MRAASPYRFELDVDPELWFLEDDGYELAVVHSHISSRAYPSRTDVENIGLWTGKPYLVYCLREDDLAGFTIGEDGAIVPLALAGLHRRFGAESPLPGEGRHAAHTVLSRF